MTDAVVVVAEQLRRRVPGGIGRYAAGLLAGLSGPGVDAPPVTVAASRAPAGGPDPLARFGFPLETSPLPAPFLTLAWDWGLAPVSTPAGVLHAVSLAAPPVRPSRRRGGPALVVVVHDLAWRSHPAATTRRGRRWHDAALRRALRRADALVVPSVPVRDQLRAVGAVAKRVHVIGHGTDHLPAPDADAASDLLRRLGVEGEYLLCAGTLEPRKNLARLARAYATGRSALPEPWPLVVVGPSGWGRGAPVAAKGVVFAGAVGDDVLAALYGGARAFAYVPLTEGFGLPPVEAMACGVPVVTSITVPSAIPAAGHEPPALRVDPCSVEAIAAALVEAATDDALRASLIARGHELVRPMTWARSAAAHVELWSSLSAESGGQRS